MSDGPSFADAEHPGSLDTSTMFTDDGLSDEAAQWYNDAIPYAARIMWEAAQASDEVRAVFERDAATWELFEAMRAETPAKLEDLYDLSLSANQGGTAENMVRNELADGGDDE